MAHKIRWDDLQVVLAVAEHGSASRAAAALGINHTTVIRRVGAFEKSHGVQLFERHPTGLRPTSAGHNLLDATRSIETVVTGIERQILGQDQKLEGPIVLTTTDSIANGVLYPLLETFHLKFPKITIDLVVTNARLDLPRLDADLAVRPSRNPPEHLVGRNVTGMAFTVYGEARALERWARAPGEARPWIGISRDLKNSPVDAWMQPIEASGCVVARANSFVAARELAASGIGLSVLPCFYGDPDKRLVRTEPPQPELDTQVWILAHRDLRNTARVRALSDHLARGLRRQRDLFEGRKYNRGEVKG